MTIKKTIKKLSKIKKKLTKKTIPLGLALILIVDAIAFTGLTEYFILKKKFTQQTELLVAANKNPEAMVKEIARQVTPAGGYTTSLSWGDIAKRLVEVGAIDKQKYQKIFTSNTNGKQELDILEADSDKKIAINENNSRFVVNTLWALGLVNKSKVLDQGPMQGAGTSLKNFASTAGWTLGTKPAMELYSSQELIPLTEEQQELVSKIAANVYRPCCGNPTAFPDCNHGMAALGYIELAVSHGLSEEQIYQDLLAFNSFWFPQTYVEMAVYFQKELGIAWDKVDPQLALSDQYSSAQGARKIKQAVQSVPGLKSQGGSCGA